MDARELRQLIARAAAEGWTELDLSDRELTELPPEIGQLRVLTSLNLWNNQLTNLPAEIGQLTTLISLDLIGNQLTGLPAEIGQLTALSLLDLHRNQLTSLPAEIGQLTALISLDLSGNQLTNLPAEIGQLTALTLLDLGGNHLTILPAEIGQLRALNSLDLFSNQLTNLPAEIGQLRALTLLNLGRNKLTSLPAEIGQLRALTSLDLSRNKLASLPPEIGQLTALTVLSLWGNKLTNLPAKIGQLSSLNWLNLNINKLISLPTGIGKLASLSWLDLWNNQLTSLPAEIGRLTALTEFDLGDNGLTSLLAEIGQLTALTSLDLWNNQLTSLSTEIGQLMALTRLNLGRNRLMSLPAEIGQLTALGILDLRDNPLPLPAEVLEDYENPAGILATWQDYLSRQTRPLHELKLILVGDGSVGKTSLVNRLLWDRFDPNEDKTPGIAIHDWQRPHPANPDNLVRLHIWDFGGQEMMHATHQFFLTSRSLYLLVINTRQGEGEAQLNYWLHLIESFAAGSPILVVLNKTDQHPEDVDRRRWQAQRPAIAGFFRTCCASGEGIAALQQAIDAQLGTLPHLNDAIPNRWFDLKERLAALVADPQNALDYLSYEQYVSHCQTAAVVAAAEQAATLSLLHQLGIALYYPDLGETSILNPNWVTQGIYALLNDEGVIASGGRFTLAQMGSLLDSGRYPRHKHGFLLRLMQQFELCFPLEGEDDAYLLPDLLPKDSPFLPWAESGALCFRYEYDVLPRSILSRLLVRQHFYWRQEGIAWRTGMLLSYEGCQALLQGDPSAGWLEISILDQQQMAQRPLPPFFPRARDLLLRCGDLFANAAALQSLFADERLALWRDLLPQRDNAQARAEGVIALLLDRENNQGQNGLLLLLDVLAQRYKQERLGHDLAALAVEWAAQRQGTPPPRHDGARRRFLHILRADLERIHARLPRLKVTEMVPYKGVNIEYRWLRELEEDGEETFRYPNLPGRGSVREALEGIDPLPERVEWGLDR